MESKHTNQWQPNYTYLGLRVLEQMIIDTGKILLNNYPNSREIFAGDREA